VTLIGCGLMAPVALDAAAILVGEGIQARVLDMHTVKPPDVAAIGAASRELRTNWHRFDGALCVR
jgi:transketolase